MARLSVVFAALLLCLLPAAGPVGRAQAFSPGGAADPAHEEGAQLFRTWCASCHGLTAQGNGVLAPMLRKVVPDLTGIADRNGGVFPTAHVRRIVDGRDVRSHGDPEMPVWGNTFKATPEGYSEVVARARIDAVIAYLESIQKRNAH